MKHQTPETSPTSSGGESEADSISRLVSIMARLRGPAGCPWDREQTLQSLKPYLLEETYEVLEAIDSGDVDNLKKELGDVLLQILFQAQIASEHNQFSFHDVSNHLAEKLIRRHPHVFQAENDSSTLTSSHDVIRQWDHIKQQEQSHEQQNLSLLQGILKTSPALLRAFQVQKRAARGGFDWETIEPVLEKFKEELDELYAATAKTISHSSDKPVLSDSVSPQETIEEELGDVLFSLVNIARFLRVNPEEALRKATNKFMTRFELIESQAASKNKRLQDCSAEELDQWWQEAKQQDRTISPQSLNDKGTSP